MALYLQCGDPERSLQLQKLRQMWRLYQCDKDIASATGGEVKSKIAVGRRFVYLRQLT